MVCFMAESRPPVNSLRAATRRSGPSRDVLYSLHLPTDRRASGKEAGRTGRCLLLDRSGHLVSTKTGATQSVLYANPSGWPTKDRKIAA